MSVFRCGQINNQCNERTRREHQLVSALRVFLIFFSFALVSFAFLHPANGRAAEDPAIGEVDRAKLFRKMNHFIVNNRRAEFELSANPQPFVDWGIVRAGFVEYVDRQTGEIVPLNDEHPHEDADEIQAVPFGVASGVRLRAQPARKGRAFGEILKKTHPWERKRMEVNTLIYDEAVGVYRAWYEAEGGFAYAESEDFVHWTKPLKDYHPHEDHSKTNLLAVINPEEALSGPLKSLEEARPGHGGAFFVDPSAPAGERYKTSFMAHTKTLHYDDDNNPTVDEPISAMTGSGSTVIFGAVSADGIGWRVIPEPLSYHDADTQTVVKYDPLLNRYVIYTRLYELSRRSVGYAETANFRKWPLPVNILTAGPADSPSVDFYANAFSYYPGNPQIRMIFCLTYDRSVDGAGIRLASSRDGRVFHFTPGNPIIRRGEPDEVEHGFLSVKPGLVRTPDGKMLVLYSAWRMPHKFPRFHLDKVKDSGGQLVAWWPEDRLVALEAEQKGSFDTVDFILRGDRLLLNMATDRTGEVRIEVRDEEFKLIAGRSFADADPLYGDHAAIPVTWRGEDDLSAHRDQRIYLRFRLRGTKLFSIKAVNSDNLQ